MDISGVAFSPSSLFGQLPPRTFKFRWGLRRVTPKGAPPPLAIFPPHKYELRSTSISLSRTRRREEGNHFAVEAKPSSSWDYDGGSSSSSSLEEEDVASFLDPPKELIPLDPSSYNPAAYLWKKIGDIPEERRHHLLDILKARLISRMWEIAGTRYQDAKLSKKTSSTLLSMGASSIRKELWGCRTSKGSLRIAWNWIDNFKKAIFRGNDGETYGRLLLGGLISANLENLYGPLYFTVRQATEVMSTEQPCDLAYEFGDGLLDLHDFPEGFPESAEHRWPFNDHLVIYLRHAGPGVLVGQAWQEGKDLEQVPKKFCGEILMVKEYSASD